MTELHGKPVSSVVGTSPIETWGRVLVKLGLIDEIVLKTGLEAISEARKEGLSEAKDKLSGRTRQSAPVSVAVSASPSSSDERDANEDENENREKPTELGKEPPNEEEIALRAQISNLMNELVNAEEEDRRASFTLADARVAALGLFLCNPFQNDETSKTQQHSWLATAVRKEKSRMGSSGNKKKVVTATDLLDRNDTIFSTDVEACIEGLPGSEYCKPYIFQAFRTGGASSRSWIHEAQVRAEQEEKLEAKKDGDTSENGGDEQEHERSGKRRKKEDYKDAKKKQRLEEEDAKKKSRIEERLERLRVQVEERLFKEASAQREKVITALARTLGREFNRRRKAAELVSGQVCVESKHAVASKPKLNLAISELPTAVGKVFDEDVVRVWDFMATFGSLFLERGFVTEIPSLASLQDAVHCLRGAKTSSPLSKDDAIALLTEVAVALCKPMAANLTRILFASLIALYPGLQKDFGATFFQESATIDNDSNSISTSEILIPVNAFTWQEIARQSFVADALGELGYARHEVAHVLRGYRSAGHPNSKEARRLRKAEEFAVTLLRQTILESKFPDRCTMESGKVTRVDVPCDPKCGVDDFRFYLHLFISNKSISPKEAQRYLDEAMRALENGEESHVTSDSNMKMEIQSIVNQLQVAGKDAMASLQSRALAIFDEPGLCTGNNSYVRAPLFSGQSLESDMARQQLGLLNDLLLTNSQYRMRVHSRENYMDDALKLKLELEREEEEDDDDDDNDVSSGENSNPAGKPEALVKELAPDGNEANEPGGVNSTKEGKGGSPIGKESAPSGDDENESSTNLKPATEGPSSSAAPSTSGGRSSRVAKGMSRSPIFDECCADVPSAPDLLRRCLAVLRTLSVAECAEPFHYPVDPQTNPAYYDSLLQPMCLREVGRYLQDAATEVNANVGDTTMYVEQVVAQFARNIRLIGKNCLVYSNAGPMVISAGMELLRIFERLLLDWVLAPENCLPPLELLHDDKCIDHHPSDIESTVILCDGCEGKYNIARLSPPLHDIPKGDWYCPRCVSGRWWGDLDERVGKTVTESSDTARKGEKATIQKCFLHYPDGSEAPSLMYVVLFTDGHKEAWPLEKVDANLTTPVPPIRCLAAVSESVGYGFGVNHGLRQDLVPVVLNPNYSDAAAQVALTSSVYRDTLAASGTLLLIDPREMTADEWLRLLVLLVMKCASSELMQTVMSNMENEAAQKKAEGMEEVAKISQPADALPPVDGLICFEEEKAKDPSSSSPSIQDGESPTGAEKGTQAPLVVSSSSTASVSPDAMDIETSEAIGSEMLVNPIESAFIEKRRRQKTSEESFIAHCIKCQVRPAVASFEEDTFSPLVDSNLSAMNSPLGFSSVRCRKQVCVFCGLKDVDLGTPLVRVPNADEWNELIAHGGRSRRAFLVADIPAPPPKKFSTVAVKCIVDNELFSVSETPNALIPDGGMTEFLPRSSAAFQDELIFRYDWDIPFVLGSLSAHECCAVAAHNARKEQMVIRHKDKLEHDLEKEFGKSCGRTLSIAEDTLGRSYWQFTNDREALFLCSRESRTQWYRFSAAPKIASVIVSLGRDPAARELRKAFPEASALIKDGSWSSALWKSQYPKLDDAIVGRTMNVDTENEGSPRMEVEGGFDVSILIMCVFHF